MAKLPNYLRAHRKRLGLSQQEVAFLLGTRCSARANRHELSARIPNLTTAVAYEVIFETPVRELFAGLFQKIQKDVIARANVLKHKICRGKTKAQATRKRQSIINIANRHLS